MFQAYEKGAPTKGTPIENVTLNETNPESIQKNQSIPKLTRRGANFYVKL
jgi:hypothetical protein